MAHRGGYVVLELNVSESDPAGRPHQTRRGGDGVLYCTCTGWKMSRKTPKTCRHTEDYVRRNPGTSYGPGLGAWSASVAKESPNTLRAVLVLEQRAAKKRGVETPPAALRAYAAELDLDF